MRLPLRCLLLSVLGLPAAGLSAADTWTFTWKDEFRPDALLDLRHLNERVAGEHGFLRLSADGASILRGDGQPMRFWAMNTFGKGDVITRSLEDWRAQARFLAKQGFNLVRTQFSFHDYGYGSPEKTPGYHDRTLAEYAPGYIEGCWKMVAAMREQGIYVSISPFWAHGEYTVPRGWDLEGISGQKVALNGLIYFNAKLQEAYKRFCRDLYLKPNPHTGIPLAKDPAVGLLITMNEDSLFWWTTQAMPLPQKRILATQYAAWLAKRHGSLEAAYAAWGGTTLGERKNEIADDRAAGVVGLYSIWEMTSANAGKVSLVRRADQLRFFAEVQHGFFAMIKDFYRTELGMSQPITPENWRTAEDSRWLDLERWSYTAQDVPAKTKYFGGQHEGENNGWMVRDGQFYSDVSALLQPWRLPTSFKQIAGHPFINHETSWVNPNLYQSEGPFLVAAYQSLTGVDAVTWFNANDPGFDLDPIITLPWRNNLRIHDKWTCLTPTLAGTFPAAALAYRRGDLREAAPVVREHRSLAGLWAADEPIISEDQAYDPNQDRGQLHEGMQQSQVSPLAFLVGPVLTSYEEKPQPHQVADLAPFIDAQARRVRSATGEITLEYQTGWCTIDTPRTQGVTGFLAKRGPVTLASCEIASTDAYATVMVTSLDDQPLAVSRKVLVQVTTTARPKGWQTAPARFGKDQEHEGQRIVSVGENTWEVASSAVRLRLANPRLRTATVLDTAGYAAGTIAVQAAGDGIAVAMPPKAMHLVLSAD
jgi:hypothetical protein